jgi:hypothetical protein
MKYNQNLKKVKNHWSLLGNYGVFGMELSSHYGSNYTHIFEKLLAF